MKNKDLPEIGEEVIWDGLLKVTVTAVDPKTGEIEINYDGLTRWTWPQYIERFKKTNDMELHEFEGATKLKAAHDALKAERDEMRSLLLDIWQAANPSILEDDPTGVRLPPDLLRRVESIVSKSAYEQFKKEFSE